MEPIQAVVLGAVQGLTEFLPVSSSGHLVLGQHLFGLTEPELLFDISLHIGTLLAVLVVFAKEIGGMLSALARLPKLSAEAGGWRPLLLQNEAVRCAWLIVVGSVPTAVLGLGFHRAAERIFASVPIVGGMLLVTGCLLWATRNRSAGSRPVLSMTAKDALIIGLMQGVAILPGISRSGATISAALFLGVDRATAGRFSFLLSLPAICGALLLEIKDGAAAGAPVPLLLLGGAVAAVTGWLALIVLLRIVKSGHLHRFAPYCWALGAAVLVWRFVL
ncbi:MAG: undecaprenyl-diphosphate phosphatase [Desulfobacterales bacterium]|jgi:undecaprenyl-diphosphatase